MKKARPIRSRSCRCAGQCEATGLWPLVHGPLGHPAALPPGSSRHGHLFLFVLQSRTFLNKTER